jgi:hypothetical protein
MVIIYRWLLLGLPLIFHSDLRFRPILRLAFAFCDIHGRSKRLGWFDSLITQKTDVITLMSVTHCMYPKVRLWGHHDQSLRL